MVSSRKIRSQCGLLLENAKGEVLLQLRDDKPTIPYPNTLGTFGGQIEEGETPDEAIVREIKEEISYELADFEHFGTYPYDGYEIYMYRKVDPDVELEHLTVCEGQCGVFISKDDLYGGSLKFAFNCRDIVEEYFRLYS